jgi:hypothetical protein
MRPCRQRSGEALLAARRPELQPLIDHLREAAQGRDDIRIECVGRIAGGWLACKERRGEELIAAGLLMLAGASTSTSWISGSAWAGSGDAGQRRSLDSAQAEPLAFGRRPRRARHEPVLVHRVQMRSVSAASHAIPRA